MCSMLCATMSAFALFVLSERSTSRRTLGSGLADASIAAAIDKLFEAANHGSLTDDAKARLRLIASAATKGSAPPTCSLAAAGSTMNATTNGYQVSGRIARVVSVISWRNCGLAAKVQSKMQEK